MAAATANGTANGHAAALRSAAGVAPREKMSPEQLRARAEEVEATVRTRRAELELAALEKAERLLSSTSYEAAGSTRLRDGTRGRGRPVSGAADSHLDRRTHDDLRLSSQHAYRNFAMARAMIGRLRDVVVADGSSSRAETADKGWNTAADEAFEDWYHRLDGTGVDIRGQLTGPEMEGQVQEAMAVDGHVLALKVEEGKEGSVQLIEAERMCNPGGPGAMNLMPYFGGVEVNPATGRPVRFHIGQYGPTGQYVTGPTESRPADGAMFLVNPVRQRVNQTLGEPILAALLPDFEYLDQYNESVLVAAHVAACFAVFVTSEFPAQLQNLWAGSTVTRSDGRTAGGTDRVSDVEPGMIQHLRNGEKIQTTNPSQPSIGYTDLVWSRVQIMGADMGLPIVLSLLDFESVNMSSARAALVIAWLNVLRWQHRLVGHFLRPLREWWTARAILARILPPRDDWKKHIWTCNPPAVLDPLSEIKAESMRVDCGFSTRADALKRIDGKNLTEFYDQKQAEQKEEKRRSLVFLSALPGAKPASGDGQAGDAAAAGESGGEPADQKAAEAQGEQPEPGGDGA